MTIYTDIRNDIPFDGEGNAVDISLKDSLYIKDKGEFIVFDSRAEYETYLLEHYPNIDLT